MNKITQFLAGSACATVFAFAAFAEENHSAATVLATVDGKDITIGHVIALRGRLPEQYQQLPDDVLLEGIVEQLIQQTVLMNALEGQLDDRTALGLENEKRAFLASEMLARITEREVTEEDLKSAYAERYDAAIPDQEYDASHILVESQEQALELVKLLEDGADFATLAREKSTGPSGANGGNLGWFGKGQMVKPFEDAVVQLAVGEISAPVETQFGWHVIKMNDIRNTKVPTLEDVRDELAMEMQEKAAEDEIARLTEQANVSREELDVDPAIIRDVSLFDK